MTVAFPIHVYRAQLGQIVQSVFETMLSLSIDPMEATWSPHPDVVTSAVYFAGDWRGAVLLECTSAQAVEFTNRLMPVVPPDSKPSGLMGEDVRDTMGELANMLAGNLKSVLPRGVGLSMPSVVEGSDYTLRICGKAIVDRIPFVSPFGQFWVMLVEMEDSPQIRLFPESQ